MDQMTAAYHTDEERWKAVCERDGKAVGFFWHAVSTTGVFCRPNCGARRPKRANVRFFKTIRQAIEAGFRPCKRCRPNHGPHHNQIITKTCRVIEESETSPTLNELAAIVGLSPHHLHRLFKKATGLTPKAYADHQKGKRVRANLGSSRTVTEALYDAGFNASSRFYEQAESIVGMNPSVYRNGGHGQNIGFASCDCALGILLVAATEKGLCWISMGDNLEILKKEMLETFPKARLDQNQTLAALLANVRDIIEGSNSEPPTLPLDLQGTAFQHLVWQMLTQIPRGQVTTYKELAKSLGKPTAARAVARACATNPVAVVVPCHRVVRSDGNLAGYRWGVERKRRLLKSETKPE